MVRNTAREIAIHLSYELSFTDKTVDVLLDQRLTAEAFAEWAEEDPLYREAPDTIQTTYIRRLVKGVDEHGAELDGYIEKYAKGWRFARIPLVASAIMRVAMYEILYMPDIPNGAAINEAVEIAKKFCAAGNRRINKNWQSGDGKHRFSGSASFRGQMEGSTGNGKRGCLGNSETHNICAAGHWDCLRRPVFGGGR